MPMDEYPDLLAGAGPPPGPPPGPPAAGPGGELPVVGPGPGEGDLAGAMGPVFFSPDPEVEARAAESITPGPQGGICYDCIHFVPPSGCVGYQDNPEAGPLLEIDPERIQDSLAFRPALPEEGMMGDIPPGPGPELPPPPGPPGVPGGEEEYPPLF